MARSRVSPEHFIATYMSVFRAGGTYKDLAGELGFTLNTTYQRVGYYNRILRESGVELPRLSRPRRTVVNSAALAAIVRGSKAERLATAARREYRKKGG